MAKSKVIYWHRLGLKVYEVENNNANLLREVETTDLVELTDHLSFIKDTVVHLLLSDSISYLFKIELGPDEVVDDGFRSRLLDKVKADIPEDFANFPWDYKIVKDGERKSVLVFAPVAEVSEKIDELSKNLSIKFIVIEPESVAAERDPNPIVGIVKKTDVGGKDEEVLNIVIDEKPEGQNNVVKIVLIVFGVSVLLGLSYFGYTKFLVKKTMTVTKPVTVIEVSTVVETIVPTVTIIKKFEELNIMVQNGTKTAGKAGKVVDKLKAIGVVDVTSGNADNINYAQSKLYFKSEEIKALSVVKIQSIVAVVEGNMLIDNTMENDVKLILGIN